MAILVDDPMWTWQGRKWAHLISDRRLEELHDFAHGLGVPYLAFQGDHYDIHAGLRQTALNRGAHAVTSRQVVAALRSAGLRQRGAVEAWRWDWRVPVDRFEGAARSESMAARVLLASGALTDDPQAVEIGSAQRLDERLVVVSTPALLPIDSGMVELDDQTTLHRSSGERGTFVELRRRG